MPTPKKGPRLGGSPAHQRAILSNLARSLFEHGAITTTEAKARTLRPYAERLITKAKRGDLHNRRQVASVIRDKTTVHVLFTEIGPRYAERPGGYTRITKLGPRKGDNAPMAMIALVEAEFTAKARSTRNGADSAATSPAAATPVVADEPTADPAAVEPTGADETPDSGRADETSDSGRAEETSDSGRADDTTATESEDAETEQVEAQEAVAEQQPDGETVEPAKDADSK